jgi:hypothetical protein
MKDIIELDSKFVPNSKDNSKNILVSTSVQETNDNVDDESREDTRWLL